jgi:hypothetical protein
MIVIVMMAYSCCDEVERLVDPAEWGNIDGLSLDCAARAHTGRVLSDGGVGNGINQNLDGVLVGHQVDDLESVLHDARGKEKR